MPGEAVAVRHVGQDPGDAAVLAAVQGPLAFCEAGLEPFRGGRVIGPGAGVEEIGALGPLEDPGQGEFSPRRGRRHGLDQEVRRFG